MARRFIVSCLLTGLVSALLLPASARAEGKFHLRITGKDDQSWIIDLRDRSVTEGNGRPADATLTIQDAHLAEILKGKLDPQIAYRRC